MANKSSKQKRLDESRLKRAKALSEIDTRDEYIPPPAGAVMADLKELSHNNTYSRLPRFYVDKVFKCRGCGKEEVWPAEQQKWWYEVIKGNINSSAVRCRACRDKEKARKKNA